MKELILASINFELKTPKQKRDFDKALRILRKFGISKLKSFQDVQVTPVLEE